MDRRITRTDVVVGALIIALGVLQLCLVRRSDVFIDGDTTYLELAESIAQGRSYGFNGTPETLLPPGFPAFLAVLCVSVGCGHATDTRAMAVFATLGFLFSYALLRRVGGRGVAAAACLLPMSSPEVFSLITNLVESDPPYFAAMALALWLALDLDAARTRRDRILLSWFLAVLTAVALLLRSAAVSLLAGAMAWLAASWLMDRASTGRRLRSLTPLLLLGVVVQGAWMLWAGSHQVWEWPLGGYPKPYLSQLLVVSGNQPELGQASWLDLARRVEGNLLVYTATIVQLLTRHWILPDWASPAVSLALALLLLGLGGSILRKGGALHDWAFIVSSAMLVVWPWNFELRFVLPLLPLVCWYLYRGAREFGEQARLRPRGLGLAVLALSVLLAVMAGRWAVKQPSLQPLASLGFWIALAGAALWLIRRRELPFRAGLSRALASPAAVASLLLLLGGLVGLGVVQQLAVGRQNLAPDLTRFGNYPDLEAARWLREHTGRDAVLMARQVDVVHHHSDRRVVWFPPLSDTQALMDGIRRHGVQWLVVTQKDWSYWLPKEAEIFEALFQAHPESFHLEASGQRWRIFAVDARADARAGTPPRHVATDPSAGRP